LLEYPLQFLGSYLRNCRDVVGGHSESYHHIVAHMPNGQATDRADTNYPGN
jgi:hypothetical protein